MNIYLLYQIWKAKSLTEDKFQSKAGQNLHHLQICSDTKDSTIYTPHPYLPISEEKSPLGRLFANTQKLILS